MKKYLLFLLVLTSCTTINIESSYNQKTKVTIKKALLIVDKTYTTPFMDDFVDSLRSYLKGVNIETTKIERGPLSFLTDDSIQTISRNLQPDVVIKLSKLEDKIRGTGRHAYVNGSSYLLIFSKFPGNEEYWKAVITTINEDESYHEAISRTAKELYLKLKLETM